MMTFSRVIGGFPVLLRWTCRANWRQELFHSVVLLGVMETANIWIKSKQWKHHFVFFLRGCLLDVMLIHMWQAGLTYVVMNFVWQSQKSRRLPQIFPKGKREMPDVTGSTMQTWRMDCSKANLRAQTTTPPPPSPTPQAHLLQEAQWENLENVF